MKIEKCPFCGSEAEVYTDFLTGDKEDEYLVECKTCLSHTTNFKTKELAIIAWNKRTGEFPDEVMGKDTVGKYFTKDGTDIWRMIAYCEHPTATMENIETKERISEAVGSHVLEPFILLKAVKEVE